MRLDVSHRTTYRYEDPVALSQHLAHMTPRETPAQRVLRSALIIEPAPSYRTDARDAFGNIATLIEIERPHEELVIHATSSVEVSRSRGIEPTNSPAWDSMDRIIHAAPPSEEVREARQLRCMSALTRAPAELIEYAAPSFLPGRPLGDATLDLTRRIKREFAFDTTATDVSTPIAEVLRTRRGVCQDFAHMMIAALRAHRIPARYMSGYIVTHPPPGRPKLEGADASHAWVSIWCGPGIGWLDYDPTNGRLAGDDYATVGWGRDYTDISPISGILLGGGKHAVEVGVDVKVVG